MDAEFNVLGRRLTAHDLDERMVRWLDKFWSYPQHQISTVPFRLSIGPAEIIPDLTESTWIRRRVKLTDRELEIANRGPRWVGLDRDTGVELIIASAAAEITLWGPGWDRSENAHHYLYLLIAEVLRVSGLIPLHAALVQRDGRTTALLGQSGTGKSTTLLRMSRGGWAPLAEDLCWVEPQSLRVFGWDRGVRLWPDNAGRFFAGDTPAPGPDGKTLIPYDRVSGGERREGTLTDIVLLTRKDDVAPRWEPVATATGVRAIWESTGVPLSLEARAEAGRGVERIARNVTFSRLVLGRIGDPVPPNEVL